MRDTGRSTAPQSNPATSGQASPARPRWLRYDPLADGAKTVRHRRTARRLPLTGRLSAACLLLALTGCATTHSYTPVPCLTQSQYNDLKAKEPPKVHDQLNGDAAHDVGPLAGSAIRLRGYADGLLTVLGGCTGPSK